MDYKPQGLIVPMVTPLKTVEGVLTIDQYSLGRLIEHIIPYADTLFIAGGAGEFAQMPIIERENLFRLVADFVKGRISVIAGITAPTLQQTLHYAKMAEDLGFDAVVVNLLFEQNENYLEKISEIEHVTKLPIILYEIPEKQNGKILNVNEVKELISNTPQVVGIKVTTDDYGLIAPWLDLRSDSFRVLLGSIPLFQKAFAVGVDGYVPIAANLFPEEFSWSNIVEDGKIVEDNLNMLLEIRDQYANLESVKKELCKQGIIASDLVF